MAGRGATTFNGVEFRWQSVGAAIVARPGCLHADATNTLKGQHSGVSWRLRRVQDLRRPPFVECIGGLRVANLPDSSVLWKFGNPTCGPASGAYFLSTTPAMGTANVGLLHHRLHSMSSDVLSRAYVNPSMGPSSLLKGTQTSLPVSIRELGRQADLAFRERMNRGASTSRMARWDDHGTLAIKFRSKAQDRYVLDNEHGSRARDNVCNRSEV
ncbi:hypothetical protein R1flu_024254 [Riccia fluitans]|uniref:Uncharacterized protein n=1 Tax=Riccia fluitans TaxID=41844 RepID=A0ABD1XUC9_9MARC